MYTVTLKFRDENAPTKVKELGTLDAAMLEAKAAIHNYAALSFVAVNDDVKKERHILSPLGYMLTTPWDPNTSQHTLKRW